MDVMSSEWVDVCEKIGTVGFLASQKCIEASSPFRTVPVAMVLPSRETSKLRNPTPFGERTS